MFKDLLIATHNQGKVIEFDKLLDGLDVNIKSAADFDLSEPEETEDSFIGNALLKARAAFKETGLPTLADDSGICIDSLGGAPGIYSARWAIKPDGRRDFNFAINEVNKKMNGINGSETAYFIAVLALVFPDEQGNMKEEIFEGRMNGILCWPPRGDKGFGYDPIFVPEGHKITFAEMEKNEKQAISHRAKAVEKFKNYLLNGAS